MDTKPTSLLADLQQRVSDLLRNSPAADIERNLKAVLAQSFQRIELVTRDEFDRELDRVAHLEQRIETLERALALAGISAGADDERGTTAVGQAGGDASAKDGAAAATAAGPAAPARAPGGTASGAPDDPA